MAVLSDGAREAPSGVWREQRALTTGLLLVVTLVAFETLAVATVLPAAEKDLGSIRLYGWAFSAFLLASLVGIVWAGRECDVRSPARPFAAGLGFFSAGLLIAGLAPSMLVLVVGRAVQGLGAGVVPAVAYVSIGRGYQEEVRARMFALFSTAWIVPGLAGPGLAAVVAEEASWRFVFIGLLPAVAAGGLLTVPALRTLGAGAGSGDGHDLPSVPRAVQLAVGAGLVLGGSTASRWEFGIPVAAVGVTVSVPALRVLAPPGTFRFGRGLPAAIAGNGLLNLAFFGADAFIALVIVRMRGEPTYVAGLVLTLSTITWTAGAWGVERWGKRVDRARLMGAGLVCIAAGSAGMALTLAESVPVLVALPAWSVAALGMGLSYSSFNVTVLALAPAGREGATSAAVKLAESLGGAIGTGGGGAIIAMGAALGHERSAAAGIFVAMAALALLAIVPAVRTRPVG